MAEEKVTRRIRRMVDLNQELIKHITRTFCNAYRKGNWDEDLHAQAVLIACRCASRWSPNRDSAFSTYLKSSLINSLLRYVQKYPAPAAAPENFCPVYNETHPVDRISVFEILAELSDEAMYVAKLVIDAPRELSDMFYPLDRKISRKDVRCAIRKYLMVCHHWSARRIGDCFNELQAAFSNPQPFIRPCAVVGDFSGPSNEER